AQATKGPLRVTSNGQSQSLANLTPPAVFGANPFSPNPIPRGQFLIILGGRFFSETTVTVAGQTAQVAPGTSPSENAITVTLPQGGSPGSGHVLITTAGGTIQSANLLTII